MAIGIYKITNKINNKSYIGQSVDIGRRFSRHKTAAKYQEKHPLYDAINKYGLENFSFEILEYCTKEELNEKEIYWVDYYKSFIQNNGYNLTLGGGNVCMSFTSKLTEEDIDYIIDVLLNNTNISQQELAKEFDVGEDTISEINMGKSHIRTDIVYPIRNNKKGHYCVDCGTTVSYGSLRCFSCYSKFQRRVERPNREELKYLLKNMSMVDIGKIYGVSDNTIRKWCVSENLPRRKSEIKLYSDEEWSLL